mgnify:CR=1 FL=1
MGIGSEVLCIVSGGLDMSGHEEADPRVVCAERVARGWLSERGSIWWQPERGLGLLLLQNADLSKGDLARIEVDARAITHGCCDPPTRTEQAPKEKAGMLDHMQRTDGIEADVHETAPALEITEQKSRVNKGNARVHVPILAELDNLPPTSSDHALQFGCRSNMSMIGLMQRPYLVKRMVKIDCIRIRCAYDHTAARSNIALHVVNERKRIINMLKHILGSHEIIGDRKSVV